jgi:hypothetical protein
MNYPPNPDPNEPIGSPAELDAEIERIIKDGGIRFKASYFTKELLASITYRADNSIRWFKLQPPDLQSETQPS